jgi:nicotinate-nucleotide pyrophosphorylase (carboxylating)
MIGLDRAYMVSIARMALDEDLGSGDITSLLTIPENSVSKARIISKAEGVIAGVDLAAVVFSEVDPSVSFRKTVADGDKVAVGSVVAEISGSTRSILAAERVALNYMQRMSGTATMASKYVELASGTNARIVDTRKTTPGLRRLEKYAVCMGGASNHRFGLSDGILIKDNHIAACGGVGKAVKAAKAGAPHTLKVEVEVTNLDQLKEALDAGADAALLDNMDLETMRKCVDFTAGRIVLEASGNINESTVAQVAETGVDIISSGALTHSVIALDLSLKIVE